MIKIGVISDSHSAVFAANQALEYLKNKKVDLIIHAGDIVELATLKMLKRLKIPYAAVIGNNDIHLSKYRNEYALYNEPFIFDFNNIKIKLMHHPFFLDKSADIVIYGHTHYFACVKTDNTLFLNPGEICARKKPIHEFAYITIDEKNFKVTKVQSKARANLCWQESEIIFNNE